MHHPHVIASLVLLGDPGRMTGGNRYNVRMAEAGPAHGVRLTFVSYPMWPFPFPALLTPAVWARTRRARVVVVDSIVAHYAAAWVALTRSRPALGLRRAAFGRRALARGGSRAVVAVVHQPPGGMEGSRLRRRVQAPLDRLLYRRADAIIAASDALAAGLRAEGLPAERIIVVPPGADPPAAAPGPVPDLRAGRRAALLTVAAWLPRKGLLPLLDAVARLPEGAATLHLVGDTDADPEHAAHIRARLARPDLSGRVVVHGVVAPERVPLLYRAADVFVLASTEEPYGTVYGEALAAGLPVVGWDAGNLPNLVTPGREGLVVPVGDVEGLAAALAEVALDEDRRRALAGAARRRGATLWSWEQSAARFFAVVRAAPGRRS